MRVGVSGCLIGKVVEDYMPGRKSKISFLVFAGGSISHYGRGTRVGKAEEREI